MPTALLLDVVNAAYAVLSTNPNASNVANLSYHLTEIIRTLGERDDVSEVDVAKLEFVFLKHLVGHGRTNGKLILHRLMATYPQHFFDAIKAVFRGDEEPQSKGSPSDLERVHAEQCYRLLNSFSFGKNTWADSVLLNQPGKLADWTDQVRTLAAATGRTTITDSQIGRLFASTGEDPIDGLRPHRAVRDVIEKIHNEEMLRGFTSEVFNLRGVHSRGLDEGGEQEHELADNWQSIADKLSQWPHTGRFARDVSAMWRANAEQEDSRREKRHARGE